MPVKSPFAVFKCLYPFAVPHHLFVLLCSFHDVLAILSTQEAGIDRPAVFVSSCHLCLELLTSIHFNSLHWQNRGVEINLFRKAVVSLFSALSGMLSNLKLLLLLFDLDLSSAIASRSVSIFMYVFLATGLAFLLACSSSSLLTLFYPVDLSHVVVHWLYWLRPLR